MSGSGGIWFHSACDCRHVGCTCQRLQDRIKQYILKAIKNQTPPDPDLSQSNPTGTLAIGQHLLNNEECASFYDENQFSILAKERTLFHLSTLKATLIKMPKPDRALSPERIRLHAKITPLIWTRRNIWLSVNQNALTFSPTSIAINILAINTRLHSSDNSLLKRARRKC